MTTALDIIKRSMRLAGVYAVGETLSDDEANDALTSLNALVDSVSNGNMIINAMTLDSFALTSGDGEYTIGTTGDIATTRPVRIDGSSYIRQSSTDNPLTLIDANQYNSIGDKTASGSTPEFVWYRGTYPNGTLTFYPLPGAGCTLKLWSWKVFATFPALTTTVSLPPGYEDFLAFNLACNIAPEYEVEPPRGRWPVARGPKKENRNDFEHQELPRFEGMAAGARSRPGGLQACPEPAKTRAVRTGRSDASCRHQRAGQHRGGTSAAPSEGVPPIPFHRARQSRGVGDPPSACRAARVPQHREAESDGAGNRKYEDASGRPHESLAVIRTVFNTTTGLPAVTSHGPTGRGPRATDHGPRYCELHAHTAFSFLEGASEPEAIADRAAALGLGAIAVADRAGVYGLPRFAKACRENGIDGLAGAEAVLDDGSRLPLLVRDARGWSNLCRLLTTGALGAPHSGPEEPA